MKDFTYNNSTNLDASNCIWLKQMGLKETRWILDSEWFLTQHHLGNPTFKKWIG